MRNINYIALDLEYNCDGKNPVEDIIQVGLSVGSPYTDPVYKTQYLVKPKNKKVILHPFITQLTKITQEDYDANAVTWDQVVQDIAYLHMIYKPFVNPVVWGLCDAPDLINTVKEEGIDFPYFGRRIIDVKHLFCFLEGARGRSMTGGLRSSMGKYKLKFIGEPHNACDDAYNTLRFYFYLLNRQKVLEDTIKALSVLD
jgi:inhibitor of KinA sporulation pathway (predicted exonuclease)